MWMVYTLVPSVHKSECPCLLVQSAHRDGLRLPLMRSSTGRSREVQQMCFVRKDFSKLGDEAGLTSYLTFEEGCGNTTHDQTTLAFVQGRHVWDINVANATWERQISGMLHCAEIFAISPSHIHPNGRITMTIYGSGFKKPASVSKLHRIDRVGPTYYRVGKKPVCRFGYSGTSNRLRIVPATR